MSNPFDTPLQKLAQPTPPSSNPFDAPVESNSVKPPTVNPFDVQVPAKQVAPIEHGFDNTPWGMVTNVIKSLNSGEAAVPVVTGIAHFAKGLAQDTARFPVEIVQSMQQALGGVLDWTSGKKGVFQNLDPVPTDGFKWLLGDENLRGHAPVVADLEQSIKDSTFAKKHGFDKMALPLAFGTVLGSDAFNFLGAGGEESAFKHVIDHLVKETDPKKVIEILTANGIHPNIAEEAAHDIANSVDRGEIEKTLKTVEALQHAVDKQGATQAAGEGTPDAPVSSVVPESTVNRPVTTEEAKTRFLDEVVRPKQQAGEPIVIGSDEMKDHFGQDYEPARHTEIYSPATRDLYKDLVKESPEDAVRITFGGPGSGKTDFMMPVAKENFKGIIYDSTFSDIKTAVEKIKIARDAGKRVELYGILPDPEVARKFSLKREAEGTGDAALAKGRKVGTDYFVKAHVGSPAVIEHVLENGLVEPQDVHMLDLRGVHSSKDIFQKLAEGDFVKDPLATLKDIGYNESYVRSAATKAEAAAKNTGSPHAGGEPVHVPSGRGIDQGRKNNEPGGGDSALQGGGTDGRVSVGEGTQQSAARAAQEAAAASAGRKTITDNVPLPPSIGEIMTRDGKRVPLEQTPAHALETLSTGKDAKSWQSLVKGYMYNWSPQKKAHLFDVLSTPEFVLEKVGLGKGAEMLQDAKDQATTTLKKEFDTVSGFIDRVKNQSHRTGDGKVHVHTPADTSTLIFDWLDGNEKTVTPFMTEEEISVAKDIRVYLKDWAVRLKLPEESQIGKYITHIFERKVEGKESVFTQDPELAAIMAENVAKSVYDPFLQKRLGAQDYVHDVWRALDAYIKRGSRKEAMDPALKELESMAENLDPMTYKYVRDLSHKVNMRPTETEQAFDSFITQTPIGHYFTDRPTAHLSKKVRQMFYRGTLGLNLSSGLRNLTQGANTYAKLGEKYTVIGYAKLFQKMVTRDLSELYTHNVLADSFVQDRTRGSIKKTMDAIDATLFSHYTLTEMINRGSAYFGAKSQGLAKGLSEEQAIKYAKRMVRETQFSFGAVDTPTWLNDDIKKTLFQLQNYNVKQVEFLGRMLKQKDFAGLIRYSAASFAMLYTIGRLFGMTANQIIPTIGIGGAPLTSTALAAAGLTSSDPQTHAKAVSQLQRNFFTMIPGGAQIRKTLQGAAALERGGSFTDAGKFRYRVGPEDATQALLMGPSALPQAQKYYEGLNKPKAQSGGNPFD